MKNYKKFCVSPLFVNVLGRNINGFTNGPRQASQGEMDAHLGYDRYERHSGTNSRNSSSKKF